MTEAAVTGESIGKTSRKIAEKFETSEYNARRLIRTETTYACNQAELGAYKELDIDRYMYVATYAENTCEVCQKNNNKVYEQNKAKAGVNLPPMHPNCRCTTIAYFDEGMPTVRTAKDKDGKNIQIPADMTYNEWKDKYITPYRKEKEPKKKVNPAKGKYDNVVSITKKPENGYSAEKIKNLSIDFDDKSSIIKSIDSDDYNLVTYGKDIAPEVNDVILNTMKKCEKEGGFVISEISPAVKPTSHGTPVLQIEPLPNGLVQLNVNTDYLSGKTLEEINRAFLDTDSTVVNSLEEAVIHESGHAISIKGKKGGEIGNYYAMLKPLGKSGVSEIALSDGAECLAELEVLRHRKTKVSKELSDFYEKYMGRKYL
jgi:SPP1 gp7 family putative phage head morphogenesis protein